MLLRPSLLFLLSFALFFSLEPLLLSCFPLRFILSALLLLLLKSLVHGDFLGKPGFLGLLTLKFGPELGELVLLLLLLLCCLVLVIRFLGDGGAGSFVAFRARRFQGALLAQSFRAGDRRGNILFALLPLTDSLFFQGFSLSHCVVMAQASD